VSDVLDCIRQDLIEVEKVFLADTVSGVPAITEIGQYLQQSGGKRIRPALSLLTAHVCGCFDEAAVRLAAIVEMIHTATLIHDDIIDEAETRRGRPSTNSRWGPHSCVLAGDWLYMQAFNVALRERDFGVLDALISLTQTMVEGELIQLGMIAQVVDAGRHRELIERKTASLFSVSARLAALLRNRPADELDRLSRFGHHFGMAFQMVDDILDFTSSSEKLGKPAGSDLREGKMTLPAIHAWQKAAPAEREKFETVMREGGYRSVAFVEIRELLQRYCGIETARRESADHATRAREIVLTFPASCYRDALEQLTRIVIERDR
jgi:octaprenyl-diphosphate synthase